LRIAETQPTTWDFDVKAGANSDWMAV
jgi:hypothetical protein